MAGLNEGVLVNDPAGVIIYANEALAALLGREVESLYGHTIFDFMDEEGRTLAYTKLADRARGSEDRFDFKWLHADGTPIWTLVAARPAHTDDGRHVGSIVAVTDISEHKRLQQALEQSRAELEQRVEARTSELAEAVRALRDEVATRTEAERAALAANSAKTGFLANMSHELRTPLNAILGYSELLIDEPSRTLADATPDLQKIHRSGQLLLNLINDVLDLSKIEAGAIHLQVAPFRLEPLIRDVERWFVHAMSKRGNRIVFALDLPDLVSGDAKRIRQVVMNLVSNANKFSKDSTIEVRASWNEGIITLQVEDHGTGIRAVDQHRVFRPFQRADQPVEVEGTGLGLAICRQFARLMQGDVTLESEFGRGSILTFIFAAPISQE